MPFPTASSEVFIVSISAGVASYRANETAEQFTARADAALYRAKLDGRNRVNADPQEHSLSLGEMARHRLA